GAHGDAGGEGHAGHHGDHAHSGDHAHHGDHAHSGGSDMAQAMAQTPDWATAVNWVAIALSALAAVWWLLLLVRSRRIGIHTLCHAVMGLGMAGMPSAWRACSRSCEHLRPRRRRLRQR